MVNENVQRVDDILHPCRTLCDVLNLIFLLLLFNCFFNFLISVCCFIYPLNCLVKMPWCPLSIKISNNFYIIFSQLFLLSVVVWKCYQHMNLPFWSLLVLLLILLLLLCSACCLLFFNVFCMHQYLNWFRDTTQKEHGTPTK